MHVKRRLFLTAFMAVIAVTFFSGCGRKAASGPTVGLVMKTLNNPFFIDMEKGAREAAGKAGIDLIVQVPEREVDVEMQLQVVENLIQRQADVICVAPSGSREIIPAILKANKAGIPVIIVDSRVDAAALAESGGKIESFIGSDNFDGGRMAGRYIVDKYNGKARIAILEGIPGHETGDERMRGFHAAVDNEPGIDIVSSQTANFERDKGYNVFQNILESQPDVQAVFACNDMMALGAVEAIAAAGRTGDITVVGFDAVDDARQAISEGRMAASIAQHPAEMGRIAVEIARDILDGKQVAADVPVKIELVAAD